MAFAFMVGLLLYQNRGQTLKIKFHIAWIYNTVQVNIP